MFLIIRTCDRRNEAENNDKGIRRNRRSWAAGISIFLKITIMTEAERIRHLEVIVYSKPSIPDRTAYFKKNKRKSIASMLETGRRLVDLEQSILQYPV